MLRLIAGVVKLKKGATVGEYLPLGGVGGRTWLNWLGATAVLVVLSDLTTTALGRPVVPEFMTALYATAQPVWLLWLALVVGAPLFEETFFRGFLLAGLKASALRPAGAVVATSVLWSLMHLQYDAYGILTVFAMGLLFGMARIRTGSLLVPMALHAAVNLTATIQAATLPHPSADPADVCSLAIRMPARRYSGKANVTYCPGAGSGCPIRSPNDPLPAATGNVMYCRPSIR